MFSRHEEALWGTESTASLDLHRPQLGNQVAGAATGTGWTGASGRDTIFTPGSTWFFSCSTWFGAGVGTPWNDSNRPGHAPGLHGWESSLVRKELKNKHQNLKNRVQQLSAHAGLWDQGSTYCSQDIVQVYLLSVSDLLLITQGVSLSRGHPRWWEQPTPAPGKTHPVPTGHRLQFAYGRELRRCSSAHGMLEHFLRGSSQCCNSGNKDKLLENNRIWRKNAAQAAVAVETKTLNPSPCRTAIEEPQTSLKPFQDPYNTTKPSNQSETPQIALNQHLIAWENSSSS